MNRVFTPDMWLEANDNRHKQSIKTFEKLSESDKKRAMKLYRDYQLLEIVKNKIIAEYYLDNK